MRSSHVPAFLSLRLSILDLGLGERGRGGLLEYSGKVGSVLSVA